MSAPMSFVLRASLSKRNLTRSMSSRLFGSPHFLSNFSRRCMCYEARKVDITSGKQTFLFDTHQYVKNLVATGLSEAQAEAVVSSMVQVMHADVDYMNKNMVTKPQHEITLQQVMATISTLRKDMIILEKSEFSSLKHEYEKQSIELKQLRQCLQDEVTKLKSGMSLDMNLERSRSTEAHNLNEKSLMTLQNKIDIEHTVISKQFSILDNSIAKEIANLLAIYERYRNDVIKYCAGAILTCFTVSLGFYRFFSSK